MNIRLMIIKTHRLRFFKLADSGVIAERHPRSSLSGPFASLVLSKAVSADQ
jgi:hypothetical protein